MRAQTLVSFIEKLNEDPEYRDVRCAFHEEYEWLEGYWQQRPSEFDGFCRSFGDYYWQLDELRELAWDLASQGCVGSSDRGYDPTREVIKSTLFLLHRAKINRGETEVPICDTLDCYKTRNALESCNAQQQADEWNRSGFEAVMYIVRQIRNNLFHGRKLELELRQYERNRRLITIGQKITSLIIAHLVEAEQKSEFGH